MSQILARTVAAAALADSAFAGGGAAEAACYGSQNVFVACYQYRPVYSDCIYTGGGSCQPVTVSAPLCVYGTIGSTGQYQTAWC